MASRPVLALCGQEAATYGGQSRAGPLWSRGCRVWQAVPCWPSVVKRLPSMAGSPMLALCGQEAAAYGGQSRAGPLWALCGQEAATYVGQSRAGPL